MMKKIAMALVALLLPVLALAAGPTCVAGTKGATPTATITFTAPTTNSDGTPISTPLTYLLFQGTASGAEVKVNTPVTGSPATITTGLQDNTTIYFYLVVVDANGFNSVPSNEVCKTFPAGVPGAVTITIT